MSLVPRAAWLAAIAALLACGPRRGSAREGLQPALDQSEPAPITLDAGLDDAPPGVTCEQRTLQVGQAPLGYRASGQVCDGLRQGPWAFVFLDGSLHRAGSYEDGLETGPWIFLYQGGAKRAEGEFVKGQRSGTWMRYHENGTLSLEGVYQGGLRHGRWRRWHDHGQLYEDRSYQDGKREGRHHKWNEQGLLQYTRLCHDDHCEIQCQAKGTRTCPPLTEPSPAPDL